MCDNITASCRQQINKANHNQTTIQLLHKCILAKQIIFEGYTVNLHDDLLRMTDEEKQK